MSTPHAAARVARTRDARHHHTHTRDTRKHDTRKRDTILIAAVATTLWIAGCSKNKAATPTAPAGPTTGSLTVTIVPPTGVAGSVTITGPASYSKTLATSTTLTGLAPGSYTLTAAAATTVNSIVGTLSAATITGSPATVTVGDTAAASATYAQRGGSGGLWISNVTGPTGLIEYSATLLGASTSAVATTLINTGARSDANVAFDANGNAWVVLATTPSIVEYAAIQLALSATPTPVVTITANAGSLNVPQGIAFDSSGNLWVSNNTPSTVISYSAAQLVAGGSLVPAISIAIDSGLATHPFGLAFDAHGNLWVANDIGVLIEFTPAQLAVSGAHIATITIADTANSLVGPLGIAFDSAGDLWVANGNDNQNTIVKFTPSQLAASGQPIPAVTLTANAGSLSNPEYIAFDASGNMWVSNFLSIKVVEFTPSQFATSGSPVPTTTLSAGSLSRPSGLAFDPHSPALPLR